MKDAFGREDIESVNLIMSTNQGSTTVFNKEFEDDDLILDNNGLAGNFTYTYAEGIADGEYDIILEIQDIQSHTVIFEHQGVTIQTTRNIPHIASKSTGHSIDSFGQQSSVEFLVEHIGSSSTDITVQFDLARSLPSSWSDPVWSPPAGVALQGGGDSNRTNFEYRGT